MRSLPRLKIFGKVIKKLFSTFLKLAWAGKRTHNLLVILVYFLSLTTIIVLLPLVTVSKFKLEIGSSERKLKTIKGQSYFRQFASKAKGLLE